MSGTPQTTFEAKVQNMASTALEAAILAVAVDSNDAATQGAGRQALRVAGLDPHLTDLMVTHSLHCTCGAGNDAQESLGSREA